MKKQIVITMLVAAATSVAFGQGQFSTDTRNVETTLPKATPAPPRATAVPPVILAPSEGVVQVAIRTGQPIQLLNPAASAKYGNAHDHATHDPKDPGKPKGIALFAWTF